MKELDYRPDNSQLTLTDRVAIEVGLARKESFAKIAKQLKKHPHTISREVKENRTHLPAEYAFGNDCKNYAVCHRTGLCGADSEACNYPCKKCKGESCHELCDKYESSECHLTDKPPYVCNTCYYRTKCKNRYYYNAKYAKRKFWYYNRHYYKLPYLVSSLNLIFIISDIGNDCMNLTSVA